MRTPLQKLFHLSLALLLASTPLIRAQQSTTAAPIPPQITSAHTIFISNGGGSDYFSSYTDGPNRAYNQVYASLQQWNHYQLVDSPQNADLVFEIRATAALIDAGGVHSAAVYNPQLVLRILDPKTNAVLWTITSNVRPAARQKTRDKQFDDAVANLVNQTRQLTGEQLTAAQQKAIRSSYHSSTAAKVVFGVAIAGAVVGTVLIVHAATTHKNPTLPTIPPCPDPPFCPVV
jgi:hypothetical protein